MPGVDNGDDEPLQLRSRGPLGSPESAAYFRAALEELGQTTTTFAQIMKRKGDDREPAVIRQHLRRMASGDARVSGEMRVVLTMMLRAKRKGEKRTAEKRGLTTLNPTPSPHQQRPLHPPASP